MSLKAEKLADVTVNYRGHDGPGQLGWAWRGCHELKDGDWVPVRDEKGNPVREKIFGYCDYLGYLTHMSYSLNTHVHESWNRWYDEMIEREYTHSDGTKSTGLDKFFFNAGGMGVPPLYVSMDELKKAMIELGLYETTDRKEA